MKCESKKNWLLGVSASLMFTALILVVSGFSILPACSSSCTPPSNVNTTAKSIDSVNFAWDSVTEEVSFKVWYYRENDNYTSPEVITSEAWVNFSNLPAGTYRFFFVSVCGTELSQEIIVDDLIMG